MNVFAYTGPILPSHALLMPRWRGRVEVHAQRLEGVYPDFDYDRGKAPIGWWVETQNGPTLYAERDFCVGVRPRRGDFVVRTPNGTLTWMPEREFLAAFKPIEEEASPSVADAA